MLGHTEPVVDRGVAAGGVKTRRTAKFGCADAGDGLHRFRRVALFRDERLPFLVFDRIAATSHEIVIGEPLRHHDVRQRVEDGDVGAG